MMPAADSRPIQSALIVGFGSIGRRHYENLLRLGFKDIRLLRTSRSAADALPSPEGATIHTRIDAALEHSPDFAIVCNPTSLHVDTAEMFVADSIPVLLEKPVDDSLERARRLHASCANHNAIVTMGYCFRYHPLYRQAKVEIDSGRLGRVQHARLWQASYLPDWHPWEDHRKSYAARRELGGGVIKTLDHELDMLRWLLGDPLSVMCATSRSGALEADVEDTADMIFRYHNGAVATVHVSFSRRDDSRGLSIVGDEGSCDLDWNRNRLTIRRGTDVLDASQLPADFDLNSIYLEMLKDAIAGFAQHPRRPAIDLPNGVKALQMAEAALRSDELKREVQLSELVA